VFLHPSKIGDSVAQIDSNAPLKEHFYQKLIKQFIKNNCLNERMFPRDIVIHKDIIKTVGRHTYYFAERQTEKGLHGFWVGKSWTEAHQTLLSK